MKSIYFKRCLIIVGISAMVVILNHLFKANFIIIPNKDNFVNFNFNLITINSIIAGFSFTTLGIILGLSSSEIILKLNKTDIMSKKSKKIITSIVFSCGSIIVSMIFILQLHETILYKLILIVNKKYASNIYSIIMEFIFSMCIIFLLAGLLYFLKSIREVSRLIGLIYKNKSKLTNDKVVSIEAALKNTQHKNLDNEENDVFTKD